MAIASGGKEVKQPETETNNVMKKLKRLLKKNLKHTYRNITGSHVKGLRMTFLEEIGKLFGPTRERIRQIESKVLNKL